MWELIVVWLVRLAGAYLVLGILVAIPFVLRGAGRIDPAARDAAWGFRLIILPGVIALWPLFVMRIRRGQTFPPAPRDAHRAAANAEVA